MTKQEIKEAFDAIEKELDKGWKGLIKEYQKIRAVNKECKRLNDIEPEEE